MERFFRYYRDAFRGLPHEVWLISFVLFINRCGTMVFPFLTLYWTSEKGFSASDAGMLLAVYGVGSVAGAYLGGSLAARIGPVRVFVGSLVLTSIGMILLMLADTTSSTVACLLFLSIVTEAFRPAAASATADYSPAHMHTRAFAVNRLAINLGLSFGATIGGFLAEINFHWLFIVDAATCFCAAIFGAIVMDFNRKGTELAPETNADKTSNGPWTDLPFMILIGLTLLASIAFFQLLSTYPLYLNEFYHLTERWLGVLFAVNTIIIVLVEMILIHSINRFSKLKVIAWGIVFTTVGFGILPFGLPWMNGTENVISSFGFLFCVFSVVVWTIGEMLSSPVSAAYVSSRSSRANQSRYFGVYAVCFSVGTVVAPIIGTNVYEINPHAIWYGCFAIGFICFIGYWLLAWYTGD